MSRFENTAEFAVKKDEADALARFRKKFIFPQHDNRDVLYFTGNSLGLQPQGAKNALIQECDDWAKFGVEGHFRARNPWYSYHELFTENAAKLVGALPEEVVMMNQLTVNLHLLLTTFYRPEGKRKKILFETKPFPSDQYAFESQAALHGLNPDEVLVEMQPRPGELLLRTEDILDKINELGDTLAVVCFGAVNYFTGQYFNLKEITATAQKNGAIAGYDLAHAAGNVHLKLHEWNVDFACWCTYKYLNSGPGSVAGAYIHQRHAKNTDLPRLAGWWGNKKETRFQMKPHFDPMQTAEAWQLSNAPVFNMAVHKVALDIFSEAGIENLRSKSVELTSYLEYILNETEKITGQPLQVITPKNPDERGCQLSVIVEGRDRSLITALAWQGVVADWREPNVIRLAPVPLYNSFEDVYKLGVILRNIFQNS